MFGETTIFYVMIWNHPVETTIKNWLFGVPGLCTLLGWTWSHWNFDLQFFGHLLFTDAQKS